jgi:high affinity sulfate transporter 1
MSETSTTFLNAEKPTGVRRYMPILSWLPRYRKGKLTGDLIAGISVAALLIPESLGYAEIAGVPPEVGLYAAPAALLLYAMFGGSRLLVVAAASAVSAVSAGIVGGLSGGDEDAAIALTAALAVVSGLLFLAAGLARLGWVANFMSKAVMEGFIVGLSMSIIIGQLDAITGVDVTGESSIAELWDVLTQISSWDWLTVAIGAGSLLVLFGVERFVPRLPGALTVVVLSVLLVSIFNLDEEGLAIVGEIPRGLPDFGIPDVDGSDWLALIPGGLAIVLIGFSEGFAAGDEAAEPGEELDANQELVASGMANAGAGLSGGMVVSGSLSKTAANEEAGASTQVAGIVNAGLVLLTLLVLAPLFTNLAEASLGAIVIHAVWKSADPRRLVPFLEIHRVEFVIAMIVLAAVLLIGEIQAVILGVVVSLLIIVYRVSFPRTSQLGKNEATGRLVDVELDPDASTRPGVVVSRFEAPLIFSNAHAFARDLKAQIVAAEPTPDLVIIDGEVISDVDNTGAESLVAVVSEVRAAGIEVGFARIHHNVYEALERAGLVEELGADSFMPTPDDALPDEQ